MRFRQDKSYTLEEALLRMEHFCAYRERCHTEVVRKLREMKMIPEAIDTIIVQLIETDFLNESRFAMAFVQGKFRQKGWGNLRLKRELKQREISDYLIRAALASIEKGEYQERFEVLAQKRWEALKDETHLLKRKKKFVDYFNYRGWEPNMIYESLVILSKDSW